MTGKDLEEVKEAKDVKEDKLETQRDANRTGKTGWRLTNTREYSTEVNRVSITFLLAFEWSRKVLRGMRVAGSRVKS
jgi:hypothetical protein